MSLENAKKLEDLKQQAEAIHARRAAIINAQRPKAVEAAIKQMADYLKSQGFELNYRQGSERGFTATYNDIQVTAKATRDDESLVAADYAIEISRGKTTKVIQLSVQRGTRIDPVRGTNTEQKISDLQNRYLPSLESLSDGELDGSFKMFIYADNKSGKRTVELAGGKEAIDLLFEND
ncbi:hypothetical protein [Pantoea dispersa]|uniref:hypothetical protein n=1 Tax=Pantoea dispersa TaxID=59814 RepID=UPI0021C8858D|nr:hypothetical protein [Pantoea dispersa]UXO69974.1 hypothetical protein N7977_08230 [Pantoea dispersa]